MKKFPLTIFFLIVGCSNIQNDVPTPTLIVPEIPPEIIFSHDSIKATINTDTDLTNFNKFSLIANEPISIKHLINLAYPNLHDSTIKCFETVLWDTVCLVSPLL